MERVRKVSYQSLIKQVLGWWECGQPILVWGPAGIGKTDLCRAVAKRAGIETVCVLNAQTLEPTDYAMPVPNHELKQIKLYSAGFLPHKGPACIIIDDISNAKPYQQNPLMKLTLEHQIGELMFDKSIKMIATANREEDSIGANPIGLPLKNRFVHYLLEPDHEEWVYGYAKPKGLDDSIIGFILAMPQYFRDSKVDESQNAFPTPRSWTILSNYLTTNKPNDPEEIEMAAVSAVGEAATLGFMTYCRYLAALDVKQIVEKGVMPKYDESKRDQVFAIVMSVASYLQKKEAKEIAKVAKNVAAFLDTLKNDYKTVFFLQFTTWDDDAQDKDVAKMQALLEMPEFTKYAESILKILSRRK